MDQAERELLEKLSAALCGGNRSEAEKLLLALDYGVNSQGEIVDRNGVGTGVLFAKIRNRKLRRETRVTDLDRMFLDLERE